MITHISQGFPVENMKFHTKKRRKNETISQVLWIEQKMCENFTHCGKYERHSNFSLPLEGGGPRSGGGSSRVLKPNSNANIHESNRILPRFVEILSKDKDIERRWHHACKTMAHLPPQHQWNLAQALLQWRCNQEALRASGSVGTAAWLVVSAAGNQLQTSSPSRRKIGRASCRERV